MKPTACSQANARPRICFGTSSAIYVPIVTSSTRRDQRWQVHGQKTQAAVANLEDLPRESPENDGVGRLLRRTIRFQIPYVFLVLAHERRRIVHFAVTAHPTAEWTVQQMPEAFPWNTAPRYLLRDRDRIFDRDFVEQVKAMGIKQVLSAPIRRECLDSYDRVQRAKPASVHPRTSGLLSSQSPALVFDEGQSGAAAGATAGVGPDCLDSSARRAASSLRTSRRLSSSLILTQTAGQLLTPAVFCITPRDKNTSSQRSR